MNSFHGSKFGKGKKKQYIPYTAFPIEIAKSDDVNDVITGKRSSLAKQTKEYDVVHTQTRNEKKRGIVRTNKITACYEVK